MTTCVTETPAAAASVQSPVQGAYSERRPQMRSVNNRNESAATVFSRRPPLRHAQTVPQPTLDEADSAQMQKIFDLSASILGFCSEGLRQGQVYIPALVIFT